MASNVRKRQLRILDTKANLQEDKKTKVTRPTPNVALQWQSGRGRFCLHLQYSPENGRFRAGGTKKRPRARTALPAYFRQEVNN